MLVYLNGALVDEAEAKVPVTDHCFLYGDGCFETAGVWKGRVIHLDEHLARLARSARTLRIAMPVTPEELRASVLEVLSRNGLAERPSAWVRVQLSRGAGSVGVGGSDRLGAPALVILGLDESYPCPLDGTIAVRTAVMSTYTRAPASSADPRVKATNYVTAILAYLDARDRGADIALLRDSDGNVCEGHVANIFCVREGVLATPPEHVALAGITRRHVIETARRLGIGCQETFLTAYDLRNADEVFTTSAASAVAAVSRIDDLAVGDGAPGPVTRTVASAYVDRAYQTGVPIPR